MPEFAARVFSTAIFTPFLEEFAKAYPLLDRHIDNERSFLIFGAVVGLGFGVTELLIYTLLLNSPLYIRVPGVLFHLASTSITAYGIAKNRPLKPYLCAVTLHFLINISAIYELLWLISGYPILLATFSIALYLYGKASPVRASPPMGIKYLATRAGNTPPAQEIVERVERI